VRAYPAVERAADDFMPSSAGRVQRAPSAYPSQTITGQRSAPAHDAGMPAASFTPLDAAPAVQRFGDADAFDEPQVHDIDLAAALSSGVVTRAAPPAGRAAGPTTAGSESGRVQRTSERGSGAPTLHDDDLLTALRGGSPAEASPAHGQASDKPTVQRKAAASPHASVPAPGSPEAGLLELLNLPGDTPLVGLSSTPRPAAPAAPPAPAISHAPAQVSRAVEIDEMNVDVGRGQDAENESDADSEVDDPTTVDRVARRVYAILRRKLGVEQKRKY
jgi:hypothetical protein